MSRLPPGLLEEMARKRVLVVGDAMLDIYVYGDSSRLCPEAPVPVVSPTGRVLAPGGAANTAVNLRALGAAVRLLSLVGDDAEGATLRQLLDDSRLDTEHLLAPHGRRTLVKQRILSGGQLLLRLDWGDTGAPRVADEGDLLARLQALWWWCDLVVVSDYSYGMLSPTVIAALTTMQRRSPRTVVCDSKRLGDYRSAGLTAAKPNYKEALQLLGLRDPCDGRSRAAAIADESEALLGVTGARVVVVTLDTEGAVALERGRAPYRTYARPRPDRQAAGAGDTFLAAMALAVAAGAATPAATEIATAAAAVVVAKQGTACCTAGELKDALGRNLKLPDSDSLTYRLDACRRDGKRIVLTSGCFDILHRGHVNCLGRAKALGDVLVVGVNSDDTVRRLKGPGRPVNKLEDRLQVLAALGCVDFVIPFHEDTPHQLIRTVRPHAFVKGGDYTRDRLPEAALVEELGGVVEILPFVDDRSTTGIIARIQTAAPLAALAPLGAAAAAHTNGHVKA